MKKEFELPVIELVEIDNEDIIKTSGEKNFLEIPDGKDWHF